MIVRIAQRLMLCPAAPYHEDGVRGEVEAICAENGLSARRDRFGNVHIELRGRPGERPVVLAAHLDHPGFVITRGLGQGRYQATFQGGVPAVFFRRGLPVRLMPGSVKAILEKSLGEGRGFQVKVKGDRKVSVVPRFAVWDLPDFQLRKDRIVGRACDDLIGAASVLETLISLNRKKARVNAIGLLSRAEEVGFHGALAVADEGLIPKNSLVISLETSRELPAVKMGKGVIIRVGDRSSIFDSDASRFLWEAALELQAKDEDFCFQRALMSGGTCEATAFQEYGFQTGAVCVALGNYHNCASKNRIAAEFVNVKDVASMVALLEHAICRMPAFEKLTGKLRQRLRRLTVEAKRRLGRGLAAHPP